jgi:adenosine 3'-phospho 5'-phosphosulfate transporter B3
MASSALSNMSLNYINFPTKVVFRSSKLIPTMLMASVMHHQRFTVLEYTCAAAICAGLVLFAAADWELTPSFHPVGLVLVTASVVADAVLPNAQQALFTRYQASRLEVTLYTNLLTLAAYTLTTTLSGDMFGFFALLRVQVSRQLLAYFCIYTLVSYAAITAHMTVVRRYGGVAAVLVATARKGITLVLSFVLFPKAFSWYYPAGATMVLGGLLTASLYKQRNKSKAAAAAARPASPIGPSPHQC